MMNRYKLALIQCSAGQLAGPVGDLDFIESQAASAAKQGAKLVVCPECAYPAYFLRSREYYRETASRRLSFAKTLNRFASIAKKLKIHLATGVVEEREDDKEKLSNAAVLFDPAGKLLLTYRKVFLWHFDNNYFAPGDAVPVIDTAIGRLGLMICADGRCPELAAIAGRQGVQLLINPTAWVSWGRSAAALTNPQIEYFIAARAMEAGCWIASANKVGVEADSIVYCGRSNVVSPAGEMVASLGSADPGLLLADVDLAACREAIGPGDEDGYPNILFAPTASLPVTKSRAISQSQTPLPVQPTDALVLAALAGPMGQLDIASLLADLAAQGVQVLVAPGASSLDEAWVRHANRFGMILCFADRPQPGHGVTRLRLAGGRVDSFAPARAAMLADAQLFIAAPEADGRCPDLRLLRARAGENRIFVVASAIDRAVVIAPSGAILADSLADRPMAVVARMMPDDSRDKQMAPGTDVVTGRNPALYAKYLK
ncbi:MAG: hypothetical protein PHU85_02515 [Phycisphaerae bacterium]|nr:hypothetical protein [Phycisphaerae bacterium]